MTEIVLRVPSFLGLLSSNTVVSVTYLVTVRKHLTRSDFRMEGCIWAQRLKRDLVHPHLGRHGRRYREVDGHTAPLLRKQRADRKWKRPIKPEVHAQ